MDNNLLQANGVKRPRLLVVDDDLVLLELMVALLEQSYQVSAFQDPLLALAEIQAGAEFDGVVSDLCMDALSGKELFDRIQEIKPELSQRFVLVTGGASDSAGHAFIQSLGPRVLLKPFSSSLLIEHVNTWLSHPTGPDFSV